VILEINMSGPRFPSLRRLQKELGWHEVEDIRKAGKLTRRQLVELISHERSKFNLTEYEANGRPTYMLRLLVLADVAKLDYSSVEVKNGVAFYLDTGDCYNCTLFYYLGGWFISSLDSFMSNKKEIKNEY